ncbi:hypothetical protein ACIQNU_04205 [Streptomyces sp. NPDC091292]|uniref:hypothetical protein n=1 Tax=Streptomyces sp. NPDC091292 TaxID=3365991 RepID=UPI00382741CD
MGELEKMWQRESEMAGEAEDRIANDKRRDQGLPPLHCRVEASINQHGDWECGWCGEVFG